MAWRISWGKTKKRLSLHYDFYRSCIRRRNLAVVPLTQKIITFASSNDFSIMAFNESRSPHLRPSTKIVFSQVVEVASMLLFSLFWCVWFAPFFARFCDSVLGPDAGIYVSVGWRFDPSVTRFDNTFLTYGTDYGLTAATWFCALLTSARTLDGSRGVHVFGRRWSCVFRCNPLRKQRCLESSRKTASVGLGLLVLSRLPHWRTRVCKPHDVRILL